MEIRIVAVSLVPPSAIGWVYKVETVKECPYLFGVTPLYCIIPIPRPSLEILGAVSAESSFLQV